MNKTVSMLSILVASALWALSTPVFSVESAGATGASGAEGSSKTTKLGKCGDAGILDSSLITNVPWDASYPIKLAGVTISPQGSGAPDDSTKKVLCACQDDLGVAIPGFTQSMYEPARLIELVREPECLMSLGGAKTSMTNGRLRGSTGESTHDETRGYHAAFWHYHYFAFPLMLMLEMTLPNRCGDGYMSMDLMYLSEVDPTWNDDELAFFANPEAAIFSNPISIAACIADVGAAAVGKPLDSLFWCAGAWGTLYPLGGHKTSKADIPTKTSLLATRAVAALHRRLLARKTSGDEALCSAPIYPTIPKSQYKMNMMYPVAESKKMTVESTDTSGNTTSTTTGSGGAHEIGEPSLLWGSWRNIPSKEDNVYLLWRYNDCCETFF